MGRVVPLGDVAGAAVHGLDPHLGVALEIGHHDQGQVGTELPMTRQDAGQIQIGVVGTANDQVAAVALDQICDPIRLGAEHAAHREPAAAQGVGDPLGLRGLGGQHQQVRGFGLGWHARAMARSKVGG